MAIQLLNEVSPSFIAWILIILTFFFTIAWGLDAKTHAQLAYKDITDKELQVHRLILIPSLLMEFSLVAMFWLPSTMLPFFISFYLVRTIHEFIDELRFHVDRCTPQESYYHLVMWCTVHIKTWIMFVWGYFYQFAGIEQVHFIQIILYLIILFFLGIISWKEFNR